MYAWTIEKTPNLSGSCGERYRARKQLDPPSDAFREELGKAKRLLSQQKRDKGKLNSLYAPEVECLSNGKSHKRYEFGVKASIAVTNKGNFVVGRMALPGNPYGGHTLESALNQVRRIIRTRIEEAFVDRGYRGALRE